MAVTIQTHSNLFRDGHASYLHLRSRCFLWPDAPSSRPLFSSTAPTVVVNRDEQLTTKTQLVCHKESSIGSQMIHTVCEAPQTDAEREATQRPLRDNNPPTFRAPGS